MHITYGQCLLGIDIYNTDEHLLFVSVKHFNSEHILTGPGRRQPPAYSVAAQMARLNRLGRAHSHEGVTQGYHYHTDPDTDQGKHSTNCNI